ncbi:ABC transporter permease [Devosia algicola]|uniref:ABC transporter permease n=1 Tax=Devosia algicola TaxID=3026418 RepID=A0ABY7YQM6_9HYPH|nr:ABC transporter permease [Devosia algicola]WDR03556.1 ABC transporter permease [Devosia algicola]
MTETAITKPNPETERQPASTEITKQAWPIRFLWKLADSRELTLVILIALLVVVMTVVYPNNFPTRYNFSAVMLNAAQNSILVAGMMLLMIGGTFDLSIGSALALSGVVAGVVVAWWGLPAEAGLLAGIAAGAFCGLINGVIVTRININALIATLATMAIFRGATQLVSGTGVTPIGDGFKAYGQASFLGMQSPFWFALFVVAAGWWLVARTRYFRQFYFIGGNAHAAQLSGIRVARITLTGFIIMGALAGLAGVLGSARLNSAVVSAGIGVELSVITAAVLGGASLRGGEGSVLGGVLGVLLIALVQNALIINGVGVYWQNIIVGLVLLFAVSLDRFKQTHRS